MASALSAHLVVTDTVHTCSLQTRNTPLGSVTPDSATPNHRNNQYQVQLGFKNSTSYIFLAETAANSKATSPLVTEVAPTVVSKCLPRVIRSAGLYAFLCGALVTLPVILVLTLSSSINFAYGGRRKGIITSCVGRGQMSGQR